MSSGSTPTAPGTRRSRWQWLKDAFSREPDYEPLTEREMALLDRIARFTVRRHLTVPAIMFLESVRPMNYLGSQLMAFFEPVVKALFTAKEYTEVRLILEKRQSIEILVQRIEEQETSRLQSQKSPGETPISAPADEVDNPPRGEEDRSDQAVQDEVREKR